jgi:hypothetical protein
VGESVHSAELFPLLGKKFRKKTKAAKAAITSMTHQVSLR